MRFRSYHLLIEPCNWLISAAIFIAATPEDLDLRTISFGLMQLVIRLVFRLRLRHSIRLVAF